MSLEQDINLMKNKVAVVTGGSKGIGLAVSAALVARGVFVVIGDVLVQEGQQAVDALNKSAKGEVAVFQYCDVRKYDDLKKLFQVAEFQFGGVDIAILNAGVGMVGGEYTVLDDESERLIHDINVGGVIKGNKVAILHMMKRKGGVIINTASIAGIVSNGLGSYAATKHAVIGWTRSLDQLQSFNIRANAVCPYWTDTDIIKPVPNADGSRPIFYDVLDTFPKTPMEIVVDAFLMCIRNKEYCGEAIIAAPDGCHIHPHSKLPASCYTDPMLESIAKHTPKMIEIKRQQLEYASEKYFSRL